MNDEIVYIVIILLYLERFLYPLHMFFSYTPHIYKREDWKTHKKIFIALQLAPLILSAAFAYLQEDTDVAMVYGFVAPLFSIWYYILTILNIAVYVLAIYENKKYAYQLNKYQLNKVSVEERVGVIMISEVKPE